MYCINSILDSKLFYLILGSAIVLLSNFILVKVKNSRENKLRKFGICGELYQKIWLFLRINEQMVHHYLEWNYYDRLYELKKEDFSRDRINLLFKYFEDYRVQTYKLRGEIFSYVHDLSLYTGGLNKEINKIMNDINNHCFLNFDEDIKKKYINTSLENLYDTHQVVANEYLLKVQKNYDGYYGALIKYVNNLKGEIKID